MAQQKKELAVCKLSKSCWLQRESSTAFYACRKSIESRAKYEFEWTNSLLEDRFDQARWINFDDQIIEVSGNKIKLQNGFGVYARKRYTCTYDLKNKKVINTLIN